MVEGLVTGTTHRLQRAQPKQKGGEEWRGVWDELRKAEREEASKGQSTQGVFDGNTEMDVQAMGVKTIRC